MFICNHCPFVIHVAPELARLGHELPGKAAASARRGGDQQQRRQEPPGRPTGKNGDEESAQRGYAFPYLVDESQSVAQAYQAACTPDFFLFDAERRLVYRGQLDGARPSNAVPLNGESLRAALAALLAGKAVAADQRLEHRLQYQVARRQRAVLLADVAQDIDLAPRFSVDGLDPASAGRWSRCAACAVPASGGRG